MNITYTNTLSVEDFNILHEAVGWGACDPDKVKFALDRTDFIVTAMTNENEIEKTIGMARVMTDGLQALIMDVIVLPDYQRQGIGKTLMEHVMEYLNELSHTGGILVNLMSAVDKDGFYAQFGFERRPNKNRGYGMTLWLDKKENTQ